MESETAAVVFWSTEQVVWLAGALILAFVTINRLIAWVMDRRRQGDSRIYERLERLPELYVPRKELNGRLESINEKLAELKTDVSSLHGDHGNLLKALADKGKE